MKVAVVTPTIGNQYLSECIRSVDNQTYENITHYIFIDGYEHRKAVFDSCEGYSKAKFVILEDNVGKGWYGHRVYAACSFLVNADIICYLDEDNWFDSEHISSLVQEIELGADWAYSLRKIYNKNGEYICEDNCESLGKWPVYFNDSIFHIDTSSFAIKRDVATHIGHAWYGQWGADRQFFANLKHHFPKYECTTKHTLCYRLDGNPNSVTEQFFYDGNLMMTEKYNDFPWKQKLNKHIVGPGISIVL